MRYCRGGLPIVYPPLRRPESCPFAGRTLWAVGIASCLALACEKPADPPPAAPPAKAPVAMAVATPAETAPIPAADFQALARFLAGLEPIPGLLTAAQWSEHAQHQDAMWAELETVRLERMRTWAQHALTPQVPTAPLVYPFGGPDFLTANLLFPAAQSYVLIGLESPGEVLLAMPAGNAARELDPRHSTDLAAALGRLRSAFRSLLESGYFVTQQMEQDFVGGNLNGVLPTLLIFLARSQHQITGAQYLAVDPAGTVRAIRPLTAAQATALRLDFQAADGRPRALYFFSQDLSDSGMKEAPLTRFLTQLGGFNAYMKSTEYLLHLPEFSQIRDLILAGGMTILQDDSGIPLRAFAPSQFDLRFFGTYTQTLPAYREWFQPDLRDRFAEKGAQPLDFSLGYHTRIDGGCLIWAERRGGAR